MKEKGIKNVIFGLLNQAITIAFGLILPRMFITSYGSEINGLISSVNQIYGYVALLEAGIGTASLQALYKTISHNDEEATNGVLSATNIFYKRTGCYYFLAVILLAVSYPLIVTSDIPFYTISLVIIFNGLGGVINYFFQGKFRILLRAEGKNYFLSNLSTFVYILTSLLKILLIFLGCNIVFIQFTYFIVNILQMMIIMIYIKRNYKWINLSVPPNKEAIKAKNDVVVHQITGLVFSNTDTILLTLITGLKTVSVYSLYSSFFNMIKSMLYSFLDGVQFALGQTYNVDFKKFQKMEEEFEASYMVLTFMLYSILYVLILPFIEIYTRGITDIEYVDSLVAVLFTLIFLLQGARGPMQLIIEYAGHFRQTRGQAVLEMILNISVSIICSILWGIYGVLIGTIVALVYRANAIILYVSKKILKRSPVVTYKRWLWCACIFAVIVFVNSILNIRATSYFQLIIYAIPIILCIVLIYAVGMYCFEKEAFFVIAKQCKNKIYKLKR